MRLIFNLFFIAGVSQFVFSPASSLPQVNYEGNITFYGFKGFPENPSKFISTFNTSIADQGCDVDDYFAMIVPDRTESIATPWVKLVIRNLLWSRGGCVFFMDYSSFANVANNNALTPHITGIATVLLKKFDQIGHYNKQYCFGFGVGSRLCVAAGLMIGNQTFDRMDLCDPAGPGFNNVDPTQAAKSVDCINTSIDEGTNVYNCHRNFLMGYWGYYQPAYGSNSMDHHGMCPFFYISAFTYDFVPDNYYGSWSYRPATNLTNDVKMGYKGNFNRTLVRGDIFIATAKFPPYVVVNGIVDNQLKNLLQFFSSPCN